MGGEARRPKARTVPNNTVSVFDSLPGPVDCQLAGEGRSGCHRDGQLGRQTGLRPGTQARRRPRARGDSEARGIIISDHSGRPRRARAAAAAAAAVNKVKKRKRSFVRTPQKADHLRPTVRTRKRTMGAQGIALLACGMEPPALELCPAAQWACGVPACAASWLNKHRSCRALQKYRRSGIAPCVRGCAAAVQPRTGLLVLRHQRVCICGTRAMSCRFLL